MCCTAERHIFCVQHSSFCLLYLSTRYTIHSGYTSVLAVSVFEDPSKQNGSVSQSSVSQNGNTWLT